MSTLEKLTKDKHTHKSKQNGSPKYILKLFVSGILENSVRAIKNLHQICEEHLKDNYKLEIIDIYQQPEMALGEQIIVIPILIIKHPFPERRIIGDLSDFVKVLEILNCK